MSDEQKPGDPADKVADGAFGGVQSHRAGYGDDKLQRLTEWLRAHPTATLASGEGALLLAEMDRLEAWGAAVEARSDALFAAHMPRLIPAIRTAAAEKEVGRE